MTIALLERVTAAAEEAKAERTAARILVKNLADLSMSRYFAQSVISALVYLESVKMSGVKRHERETVDTNRGRRPQDRCSGL